MAICVCPLTRRTTPGVVLIVTDGGAWDAVPIVVSGGRKGFALEPRSFAPELAHSLPPGPVTCIHHAIGVPISLVHSQLHEGSDKEEEWQELGPGTKPRSLRDPMFGGETPSSPLTSPAPALLVTCHSDTSVHVWNVRTESLLPLTNSLVQRPLPLCTRYLLPSHSPAIETGVRGGGRVCAGSGVPGDDRVESCSLEISTSGGGFGGGRGDTSAGRRRSLYLLLVCRKRVELLRLVEDGQVQEVKQVKSRSACFRRALQGQGRGVPGGAGGGEEGAKGGGSLSGHVHALYFEDHAPTHDVSVTVVGCKMGVGEGAGEGAGERGGGIAPTPAGRGSASSQPPARPPPAQPPARPPPLPPGGGEGQRGPRLEVVGVVDEDEARVFSDALSPAGARKEEEEEARNEEDEEEEANTSFQELPSLDFLDEDRRGAGGRELGDHEEVGGREGGEGLVEREEMEGGLKGGVQFVAGFVPVTVVSRTPVLGGALDGKGGGEDVSVEGVVRVRCAAVFPGLELLMIGNVLLMCC